jgi:hypothetical protein
MKITRLIPVLALVLGVGTSCSENTTTPFEGPLFSEVSDGVLDLVQLTDSVEESYGWAEIDDRGGKVVDEKSGHEIRIMRDAVSEPTIFVVHTLPGRTVTVDLTAWRKIDGVWVQIHEFSRESIKLRLSYAKTGVKQPNRLKVVYVPSIEDMATFEPLATEIYKQEQKAQGKLSHFSIYSMAID